MANIKELLKRKGLSILLFYLCAVACRSIAVYVLPAIVPDGLHSLWLQLCEGLGPTLGALVVMCFFKKELFCSIMGASPKRSVFCVLFPILLLLLFDRTNGLKGALIFLGCVSYAFLEEFGWRGYLMGELANWRRPWRILFMTTLWFFWHVNVPLGINGCIFFAILLLSSWGLDQLANDTHSLVLCACIHGVFNLFKHNNGLLDYRLTIVLLAISILSWFVVWYFPFHRRNTQS